MLDLVAFGEVLWDLLDVPERGHRGNGGQRRLFRCELGGAPANVVVGMARLGARAALVSAVGRDAHGEALVAALRADGVDTRFVQQLPNRTGITFVFRDARGEPSFLFYRHDSADLAIRAEHVTAATGRARWALAGTSTWMTRELVAASNRFLAVAKEGGAHLAVDLNVREHMWPSRGAMHAAIERLAARASLVKASDADLRALAGRGAAGGDRARQKARARDDAGLRWLERHAPKATWLVTRGAGVASAIGVHGEVHVPALAAPCVDATGAGDAFLAGVMTALVAANATPDAAAPSAWTDPEIWRAALRVGHGMGRKAIARPGAVAGLVRLGRLRAMVEALRKRAR
jgi:sugar/nucleoside kinase (ribokinase family)